MKKRIKIFLPIILAVIAVVGVIAIAIANFGDSQKPGENKNNELPTGDYLTLEEIEKIEELVANLTEEEMEKLKEEAVNGVQDELTLRILLLLEDKIEIKLVKNLEIIAGMPVKGEKTLTGDASIKIFLGSNNNAMEDGILEIAKGATLHMKGLVLDGNGVCHAVVVPKGATLNYLSGTIQYASSYGIYNLGTLNIEGGTFKQCMAAAIGTQRGSTTLVRGGEFKDNYKNHIWTAAESSLEVVGGVFDHSYSHAIYNLGTFTMTGGTIKNSDRGDSCAVANFGKAYIDGGDNYIEISNCVTGLFSESDTMEVNKVYGHDMVKNFLRIKEGKGKVTNCKVENTGTYAIRVAGEVTVENIYAENLGTHGIYTSPGKITVTNVEVINAKEYGFVNCGAEVVATDIRVKGAGTSAFINYDSSFDGEGKKGLMTLVACTATDCNTNLMVRGGTQVVVQDSVFNKTTRTNVHLGDGIAELTNVKLLGANDADCSVVSIRKDSKATLTNVEIANGNRGISLAGKVTMTGGSIHDNKGELAGNALRAEENAVYKLEGVKIYNNHNTSNEMAAGVSFMSKGSHGTIINCEITNNSSIRTVGAIYAEEAELNIRGTLFKQNQTTGTDGDGGAITLEKTKSIIRECTFEENKTGTTYENVAGAIFNKAGSDLTIRDCDFINNSSGRGGAIANTGTLVIKEGTTFVGNTCTEGGAGIYNGGNGVVTDNGSIYEKNVLTDVHAGGAIRNDGANAKYTVSDATFIENYSAGDAGAIYSNSPITVKNSTFTKNSATRGAAIYYNQNDSIVITGCTFTENVARGLVDDADSVTRTKTEKLIRKRHGGAIFISNGTISNCVFVSNAADEGRDIVINSNSKSVVLSGTNTFDEEGNHVYLITNTSNVQSKVTLAGKTTGLHVVFSSENAGICIDKTYDKASEVTIVVDNYQTDIPLVVAGTTDAKGLAAATEQMNAVISGSNEICGVSTKGELSMPCVAIGGVEYTSLSAAIKAAKENDTLVILRDISIAEPIVVNKTLTITSKNGVTIKRSTSIKGEAGQSLLTVTAGTLTIAGAEGKEIVFEGNSSTKKELTRAIKVEKDAALSMEHAVIQNFYTSGKYSEAGNAIYNAGILTLNHVDFIDNKTGTQTAGGAIRNTSTAVVTMSNCKISGSETGGSGGAFYANNGATVSLTNCEFFGNKAGKEGGAIYFNGTSEFVIEDCSFIENTAQTGGALAVKQVKITDTTFEGNTADTAKVVLLKDAESYVTLVGELKGLHVQYGGNNTGVIIAGEVTGDISIVPYYAEGIRVVSATEDVSKETLKAAMKNIVVLEDPVTGNWNLSQRGYLAREACAVLSNGELYYTLQEAFEDVAEGDTITLIRDISVSSEIEVTKSVTLTSKQNVIITRHESYKGKKGASLFNVTNGTLTIQSAAGTNVTIDGNASTNEECVRAITVAEGAALHMEDAAIQNFYTSNSFGEGGTAIYNAGTMTLEDVALIDNKSGTNSAGGAIRNTSTAVVTMTDCIISGSETLNSGGAFYAAGGANVTLNNCEFTDNHAGAEGGAIYFNGTSSFVVNNCTFTGNTAVTNGGAIAAKKIQLNGSVFEENTAETGNEVFLKDAGSFVTISGEFEGLTIKYSKENALTKIAGAISGDVIIIPVYTEGIQVIAAAENVDADMLATAISKIQVAEDETTGEWNLSKKGYLVTEPCAQIGDEVYYTLKDALEEAEDGAIIKLLKDITLAESIDISKNVTITSDKKVVIARAEGYKGSKNASLINVTSGKLSFIGAEGKEIIIEGNASADKNESIRAINVVKGAALHMEYATIQNFYTSNSFGEAGNAIYNAGTVTLERVNFINNKTDSSTAGGTIRNTSTATIIMTDCMITGSATNGAGGAFYANNGAVVTLNNCEFTKNTSGGEGGAIYFNGTSSFVVNNCTFTNNTAVKGGAMSVLAATINGATFDGNEATTAGNEIYLRAASSCVTLSGAFEGLTVTYSGANVGVVIADTVTGDITLSPVYTEGTQIVGAADGLAEDKFSAATKLIKIKANGESSDWGLTTTGYLVNGICAKIGNDVYYTLQDALDAAEDGATIVLLKDITLAESIEISKNLTFTISDKSVTIARAESFKGTAKSSLINVTGGTLSFVGTAGKEIVIDGKASTQTECIRAIKVASGATLHMEYASIQNFYTKDGYGESGSAIWNEGNATFEYVDFTNNKTGTQTAGGAIRNNGSAVMELTNCTITGSEDKGNGGALYAANGTSTTLTNCVFSQNSAGLDKEGGAIYFSGTTTFVVNNCTFTENTAAKGGAMAVASATINGAIFDRNEASTTANDVFLRKDTSKVTLTGEFDGLTVTYSGDNAGIEIADLVTGDVTIIPHSYTANTQLVQKASNEITDDEFEASLGAIEVVQTGNAIWLLDKEGYLKQACAQLAANGMYFTSLKDAIDAANTLEGADEILLLSECILENYIDVISDITLKANAGVTISRAESLIGKADASMITVTSGTLNIVGADGKEIVIEGNASTDQLIRAIKVASGATLHMEHAAIQNFYTKNGYGQSGSAIWNEGNATFEYVDFTNNKTGTQTAGGAIRNNGSAVMELTNCTITGSEDKGNGGALYAANGTSTTLTNCVFSQNSAGLDKEGGAIYFSGTSTFVVNNCTFTENTASKGAAMAVASATINGATFDANDVYLRTATSKVTLAGAFDGLIVTYSSANVGVEIAGAVTGDITLIPVYTEGAQIVEAATDLSEDVFKAATKLIKVAPNAESDGWGLSTKGNLVKAPCITIQGGESYYTIQDALDAAVAGDTIVLLNDITVTEPIEITKNLTFTSEKKVTIRRAENLLGGADASMITVTGATLNIVGTEGKEIVIDGTASTQEECIRAIKVAQGAALHMEYATIQHFYTSNSFGEAGNAIYNAGTVTLEYVDFIDNKTATETAGGAIRNIANSTITMTNCMITGSKTNSSGGAFYAADKAIVTMTNCSFIDNHAGKEGGAIYFNGTSSFIVNNCTFTDNTADTAGGAISAKRITLNGAVFSGNTSAKANEVFLKNDLSYATLSGEFAGLTITYSADNVGIQIADAVTGDVTIVPYSYTENTQIVAKTGDTLTDDAYTSILQAINVVPNGEEVWLVDTDGCLKKARVQLVATNNQLVETGKYYVRLEDAINDANTIIGADEIHILDDCVVNSTINVTSDITLKANAGVTITRSDSLNGSANASMITVSSGTLSIVGVEGNEIVIDGNASGNNNESIRAIKIAQDATLRMEYATIQDFYTSNSFAEAGNAIYNAGTATLEHVNFIDNKTATSTAGGAIRNTSTSTITMTDCTITGSETNSSGGAFYAGNGAVVELNNCKFENNTAGAEGGAIYFNGSSSFVVNNCTFTNNTAANAGGAISAKQITLNGSTFTGTVSAKNNDVSLKGIGHSVTLNGTFTGLTIRYGSTAEKQIPDATPVDMIVYVETDGSLQEAKAQLVSTGKYYSSLEDAVTAAETAEGADEILVVSDCTVNTAISITSEITIIPSKSVTITAASGITGNLFKIETAGTLNMLGTEEKTITLQGTTATNSLIYNSGNATVKNLVMTSGKLGLVTYKGKTFATNVEISGSLTNGIKVADASSELTLDNVSVSNVRNTTDSHGVLINAGTIKVEGASGLTVDNAQGHGIALTGGTLTATKINVTNAGRAGISVASATVTITTVEQITNGSTVNGVSANVTIKNSTVTINGKAITEGSTTKYYELSSFK